MSNTFEEVLQPLVLETQETQTMEMDKYNIFEHSRTEFEFMTKQIRDLELKVERLERELNERDSVIGHIQSCIDELLRGSVE